MVILNILTDLYYCIVWTRKVAQIHVFRCEKLGSLFLVFMVKQIIIISQHPKQVYFK